MKNRYETETESAEVNEPEPTDRILNEGLDYVSKSRLKTYKTCPRKFWNKYICEVRPPSNVALRRGSEIHNIYEVYHENISKYIDLYGEYPEERFPFLPDWMTTEYLEPFVDNFWTFEARRRKEADSPEEYVPVSVEEEAWLEDPPVGEIPWMGSADAIVRSSTLPNFEGDGVVILDYKTGSVPDEQYREEGIYLEQEFYAVLFEEKYDVDGIAAYYPKHDTLLEADLSEEIREDVKETALAMQKEPVIENFPYEEQPLCHYGHGSCFWHEAGDSEGNQCPSTWGKKGGAGPTYG